MPMVVSRTSLIDMPANWWPKSPSGSITLYDQYTYDYATIYRTQPNVRTCVDFLARNIAQLGLHVFRRVSDKDRVRLTDHPLAQVVSRPLPEEYKVTRYRLIEALISDLGIYYNAFWLKIRVEGAPAGLLRIPPYLVSVYGSLWPTRYEVQFSNGERREFRPDQVVHFRGYNPESSISGLSPMETLRRILAEEHAAGEYREGFWQNAARMHGFVERPTSAPEWSDAARTRFMADFAALYSGGQNSGKTAVLEDDMTWKPAQFNAQESEYLSGRKLTREECARAYHIPPPLVGILDHATFSNIREQHKHLYQDCLGPWLAMVEGDIDLQLLSEFEDRQDVYSEFNIREKLQGDFEEQTKALQSAVGRPYMTADEARGIMNLRARGGDADELVTPLNVIVGGQASPRDSAPKMLEFDGFKALGFDSHDPALRDRHVDRWAQALAAHYRRQEAAIISRVSEAPAKAVIGGVWFDEDRWNRELAADLLKLNVMTAGAWGRMMLERFGGMDDVDLDAFDNTMLPWLSEHSGIQSQYINGRVMSELEKALNDPDPRFAVRALFLSAATVWALRQAISAVTSALNFGAIEGARVAGLRTKTWRVNSGNPRDAHAAMDGETVGIRDRFSNGQRWPGDPAGGAEDNANCQCSVEFGR